MGIKMNLVPLTFVTINFYLLISSLNQIKPLVSFRDLWQDGVQEPARHSHDWHQCQPMRKEVRNDWQIARPIGFYS